MAVTSPSGRSVLWFRRDLRLGDNPALLAAVDDGPDGVVPLFVVDPRLWEPAGPARRAYLVRSLAALNDALDGQLHVRGGDPATVVPEVAEQAGAASVHISADYGPYGAARDRGTRGQLADLGIALVTSGSPYAVAPGRVRKDDGTAYRVFTPFYRAWLAHGWRAPATAASQPQWRRLAGGDPLPPEPGTSVLGELRLPPTGEAAATARWASFRSRSLPDYHQQRDRPDLLGTSQLSAALRWGEIHPRTLLAALPPGAGPEAFRRQLAWREFYADVLHHAPASARSALRLSASGRAQVADTGPDADARFTAWCHGRTGFPFVDAGMRQLRSEGWMHNRVRMVVASFLVKDLHLDWATGAAWFARWLRDGDLASNQHGWQWVAGTGTDPAPYHRVFNPVTQGLRYDPDGDYVRRYLPALAGLPGPLAHEPWRNPTGLPAGYPERIVDHATERQVALSAHSAKRATPPTASTGGR